MPPFRLGKMPTIQANLLRWLCVGVLVVQGMLPGLVVCFGGTSHLAVEPAYNNVHTASLQVSGGPRPDFSRVSMHHDDYPIVMVATTESLQRLVPVPEAFPSFLSLWVEVLASGVPPTASATHFPATSLHTIILRI